MSKGVLAFLWVAALSSLGFAPSAHAQPAPRILLLDAAVTGSDVVAVGEAGAILRSGDSGRTWTAAASDARATLTGVTFAPGSGEGWAVGHDALILHTRDGGATWARQWQGDDLEASFLDVLALSSQHVIAVGAYGLYQVSTDAGRTWTRQQVLEEDMHLNRISRGPGGTLYLAGERGTLLRSGDDGATWARLTAPYDGSFYGVLPLGPETLLAYGLRGHVFRTTDDGRTWELVPLPQPVLLATGVQTRAHAIVLAGQARAHYVSRDAGVSFAPWDPGFDSAVAELLEAPDGTLLTFGEAGVTRLPPP